MKINKKITIIALSTILTSISPLMLFNTELTKVKLNELKPIYESDINLRNSLVAATEIIDYQKPIGTQTEAQLIYNMGMYPTVPELGENDNPEWKIIKQSNFNLNNSITIAETINHSDSTGNLRTGTLKFKTNYELKFKDIIPENRLDLFYKLGTRLDIDFDTKFTSKSGDTAVSPDEPDNNDSNFSTINITPEDLKKREYNETPDISDIKLTNLNIEASTNTKDVAISIINPKVDIKIKKDAMLFLISGNTPNQLNYNLEATDISNKIKEILDHKLLLFLDRVRHYLPENTEIVKDVLLDPGYEEIIDSIKPDVFQPKEVILNSPFQVEFKPTVNDQNIYNQLMFIDDGITRGFQQIPIDPKTGKQSYNFFDQYKEIIKNKKGAGIIEFKVQIREYHRVENSYILLSYNRLFKLSTNSANMDFNLYAWDPKKYEKELLKFTTPKIQNPNNPNPDKEDLITNVYYRDFLNSKTGMYKPKVAWIKKRLDTGFLLDPYDQLGNPIKDDKDKYKIGYIGQLNAPGIYGSDLGGINLGSVNQITDVHYTNTVFDINKNYQLKPPILPNKQLKKSEFFKLLKNKNNNEVLIELNEKLNKFEPKIIDPVDDASSNYLITNMASTLKGVEVTWNVEKYYANGKILTNKTDKFMIEGFLSEIGDIPGEIAKQYSLENNLERAESLISVSRYLMYILDNGNLSFEFNSGDKPVPNNVPVGAEIHGLYQYKVDVFNSLYKKYTSSVYQYLKIDDSVKQEKWQAFVDPNSKNSKTIFDWFNYENKKSPTEETENNNEIFVDFWTTIHGFHLMHYLKTIAVVKSGDEEKFIDSVLFDDLINYWNMYVNSATINPIVFPELREISDLELSIINTYESNIENFENYKLDIINKIEKELNYRFNLKYPSSTPFALVFGEDYTIPNLDIVLTNLIKNYNNNDAHVPSELIIKANIKSAKIFGETKILIANHPGAKSMLDLSGIKNPIEVKFDSWNPIFSDRVFPEFGLNNELRVEAILLKSIQTILDRQSKKTNKNKLNYGINIEDRDYEIIFTRINYETGIIEEFADINNVIDFILNPEKKDNTVFATIIPVANKNGTSKATGEARFLFNNREGNDVISPDPEGETNPDGGLDPDGDGPNPDIDKPLDPDGGKDPDGQFDMKSLLWIIPTIIGSLLIICFIIFIIRTRKKSKSI